MSTVKVSTTFGQITLKLRPDAAPKTVEHFCKLAPLFDGCCFYRSDFVIQGGLQRADGSSVQNPMKPIPVNETHTDVVLSNVRGTAAFGHWDVPDAGNSDWFINLKDNAHLDSAWWATPCLPPSIPATPRPSRQSIRSLGTFWKEGSRRSTAHRE